MAINTSKMIQIGLTLFYGQLLAVAVYDLIISGSTDTHIDSKQGNKHEHLYFNLSRILIGVSMIICSVIGLFLMWSRKYKLLFISGAFLFLILVAYIIIYTLYFSFNFEKLDESIKYQLLVQFTIKAVMILIASILTFFLATRGTYLYLKSTEN